MYSNEEPKKTIENDAEKPRRMDENAPRLTKIHIGRQKSKTAQTDSERLTDKADRQTDRQTERQTEIEKTNIVKFDAAHILILD